MSTYDELLRDPPLLLTLQPEDLAGYLLEHLNSLPVPQQEQLSRHNFIADGEIGRAVMEAWIWLEREGLLAPKPRNENWTFITRRGRRLPSHIDVEAFRKANVLPRSQLHPSIADAVWPEFLRGRYDSAVFNALREVEIAVRAVASKKVDTTLIGLALMRRAFHEETGPLTDKEAPIAERQALLSLFVGAIGYYRNGDRASRRRDRTGRGCRGHHIREPLDADRRSTCCECSWAS